MRIRERLYFGWYALTGRRGFRANVHALEASHWMPREQLDAMVSETLCRLLRHAASEAPYYRQVIGDLGLALTPESIRNDMSHLPVLTKEILQSRFDELRSSDERPGSRSNSSGGSTGTPTKVVQDDEYRMWNFANKLMFHTWSGYRPGDRLLTLWGSQRDIRGSKRNVLRQIGSAVRNQRIISCLHTGPETWDRYIRIINRLKPAQFEAYADAAYEFSQYVLTTAQTLHRPRGVLVTAGVLTPEMSRTIRRAFRCPLFNRYGSRETGDIACSCERSEGLHISEATHFIEVLDPTGAPVAPGVEGDVVVTCLHNLAMPLLRYRIEDRAVLAKQPCPCGRSTRVLAKVVGRSNDNLVAHDGSTVRGATVSHRLRQVPGLRRFQLHQDATGRVNVLVCPVPGHDGRLLQSSVEPCLGELRKALGAERQVTVKVVDDIPPSPSGKLRYVISEVARPTEPIV